MKTLSFVIFITMGFSLLNFEDNETLEANNEQNLECSKFAESDICDLNIWKIIWENGEFRCETGQNFPCIPCQDERELEEI